jgi:hypothetical protein
VRDNSEIVIKDGLGSEIIWTSSFNIWEKEFSIEGVIDGWKLVFIFVNDLKKPDGIEAIPEISKKIIIFELRGFNNILGTATESKFVFWKTSDNREISVVIQSNSINEKLDFRRVTATFYLSPDSSLKTE